MCGIFFGYCICGHGLRRSVEESSNISDSDDSPPESSKCYSCGGIFNDYHGQVLNSDIDTYEAWVTDQFLERRGPDVSKLHWIQFMNATKSLMRSCVLHLRGKPTPQPVIDNERNVLMWNGEIFDGIKVEQHENDTQILSNLLYNCASEEDILKTFEQIQGPWSFIYWQAKKQLLWFGRDMYGRRSLLWHLPSLQSHSFAISSVAVGDMEYTEIPAVGLFSIDCTAIPSKSHNIKDDSFSAVHVKMTLHPWLQCRWPETRDFVADTRPEDLPSKLKYSPNHVSISIASSQILQSWIPCMNTTFPKEVMCHPWHSANDNNLEEEDELVKMLETILKKNAELKDLAEKLVLSLQSSVEKRLKNLPLNETNVATESQEEMTVPHARLAILFSGGLDSSVLAVLADRCMPADEPIDLLNVAFEQSAPEPAQTRQKQKSKQLPKEKKQSNVLKEVASVFQQTRSEQISCAAKLQELSLPAVDRAGPELLKTFPSEQSTYSQTLICEAANIEKETKHISSLTNATYFDPYDVPDRKTGKVAYTELCRINPRRRWNFVEINVTQEELKLKRQSQIRKLIYPLCTVLDDSIGCALWFAASGKGKLINDEDKTFISSSKVILCGMAADEQFAGYSRHRAHFNNFGWEGLICQLQQEIWRISQRNLGRDDRIISDHGKEARFPFLDETFAKFVSEIPIHKRADLTLPRGVGEKLLLRISAFILGLRVTACHAKRAIQFGSKIAKLDKAKEKGSDVCERLV